jgi:hypothetical protein
MSKVNPGFMYRLNYFGTLKRLLNAGINFAEWMLVRCWECNVTLPTPPVNTVQ